MRILCILFSVLVLSSAGQTTFQDISNEIPLSNVVSHDLTGSGVSMADMDNDGDLDIAFAGIAEHGLLILSREIEGYSEQFLEVSFDMRASLWLDYDGDRLLDLLVAGDCGVGVEGCAPSDYLGLFHQTTPGVFEDASTLLPNLDFQLGLDGTLGGLAAGDLNLDGFLDIVITYWRGEIAILMNQNGEEFIKVEASTENGVYYQPLIYDLDDDHLPDIYVAADSNNPNIFLTQPGDNTYENTAQSLGLDHQCSDMGFSLWDYDGDEDFDLYITCIHTNSILKKEADDTYLDIGSLTEESTGWGWGTTAFDADNDGNIDLAETNGMRISFGWDQSRLWMNDGTGNFLDASEPTNFNDTLMATALIAGDIDRDGDLDLVQSLKSEFHPDIPALRIIENRLEEHEAGNFLVIKPRMRGKNHLAIGSKVKIVTSEGSQVRPITAGISFYGQEPAEAFFGLGTLAFVDQVQIIWPGGGTTTLDGVSANQEVIIYDDEALHPPFITRAVAESTSSILLEWDPMNTSATEFWIERSTDRDFQNSFSFSVLNTEGSHLDENLISATVYYYRMRAIRQGETTRYSNILSGRTKTIPIQAPGNLSGHVNANLEAEISWSDESMNEDGFRIQRSQSAQFELFQEFELGKDQSSYIDSGLEPGATYFYRVYAFKENSHSPFSSTLTIQTVYQPLASVNVEEIEVFPNPSDGSISVSIPGFENAVIQILDASGKKIVERVPQSEKFELNLDVPPGLYLLRIQMENSQSEIRKIFIRE